MLLVLLVLLGAFLAKVAVDVPLVYLGFCYLLMVRPLNCVHYVSVYIKREYNTIPT